MDYLPLYYTMREWRWKRHPNMVAVWVDLLLRAQYRDGGAGSVDLMEGQLLTSYNALSESIGLSPKVIRNCIAKLKKTGEIQVRSTRHYSVITICKWETYKRYGHTKGTPRAHEGRTEGEPRANNGHHNKIEERREEEKETIARAHFSLPGVPVGLGYREPLYREFLEAYKANGGGINLNPGKVRQAMANRDEHELRQIIDAIPAAAVMCREKRSAIPCGSKFITDELWRIKATPEQLAEKCDSDQDAKAKREAELAEYRRTGIRADGCCD